MPCRWLRLLEHCGMHCVAETDVFTAYATGCQVVANHAVFVFTYVRMHGWRPSAPSGQPVIGTANSVVQPCRAGLAMNGEH